MSDATAMTLDAPLAQVSVAPPMGMVSLRAAHDMTLKTTLGSFQLGVPEQRQITTYPGGRVAWMSPDELLILLDKDRTTDLVERLSVVLRGHHHMVTDVSDARAVFRVDGPKADQVIAKLCPVDVLDGAFPMGELRRTRLAQVAAAFWRDEAGFTLVCFRSVAQYALDVLSVAARPGTDL
ncbi:MAG: sarcosine oxidase subunit gamma family protein [Pseudomonadota bacterium]